MGPPAELDALPDDIYRCVMHERATITGTYLFVGPPHHAAISWALKATPPSRPGASRVDVTLTPHGEATVVRLVHIGLRHPALAPTTRAGSVTSASLTVVLSVP